MRLARRSCSGVAVAALLAGCGSRATGGVPADSGSVHATGQATSQARQVLARYEKSFHSTATRSVGITSELVSQVGTWEPTIGGNNKIAVLTGHVRELPATATSADGSTVQWADGRKMPVRTISAHQAVRTVQHPAGKQSCYGCTPVVLGDPRLTRAAVQTTTGNATVPAWSFAVRGSRVRITVVAVDTAAILPTLPEVSGPPGPYVAVDSAVVVGPATLTLSFVGAPGTGRVECGADYTATAIESRHAVAVLVREVPHQEPVGDGCAAVGHLRTATVRLTAPLAGRAVLDAVHGQAVPLQ